MKTNTKSFIKSLTSPFLKDFLKLLTAWKLSFIVNVLFFAFALPTKWDGGFSKAVLYEFISDKTIAIIIAEGLASYPQTWLRIIVYSAIF